jgi:hypothetical protein
MIPSSLDVAQGNQGRLRLGLRCTLGVGFGEFEIYLRT